jgi:hypothetical protein
MSAKRRDTDFALNKITHIDFKQLEMDRVLVAFLERLKHNGQTSRIARKGDLSVETILTEFLENKAKFEGFDKHKQVAHHWIETHLVDMVNRGKVNATFASPRPLHGYAYRFRNRKHSRPYGADQQVYEMLFHAKRGQQALDALKRFFFEGEDPITGQSDSGVVIDVETQALKHLSDQVAQEVPELNSRQVHRPLCLSGANLLAEDVLRLMAYSRFIPRSVMVEYLKTLFAFHMGLYHLRLLKLLPSMVQDRGANSSCSQVCNVREGLCRQQVSIVLDVAGIPGTPMAKLAERSAEAHYNRIPRYVIAHYSARKLTEFAEFRRKGQGLGKASGEDPESLEDVLKLLGPKFETDREGFFAQRLSGLIDSETQDSDELTPEVQALLQMMPTNFDKYVEWLTHLRGQYHRSFIVRCLDSLLMKNTPSAVLTQARGPKALRRFMLGGQLLEVLLQILMVQAEPNGQGVRTQPIRLNDLIDQLRTRYGLHLDRLPEGDGFDETSIHDHAALGGNLEAFRMRLREFGFFRDLSDASVSQTVVPRYKVGGTA